MRQLLNSRLWLALGLLSASGLFLYVISCSDCFGRGSDAVAIKDSVEKNIELVAVISTFSTADGLSIESGRTVSDASAGLDDGRNIFIASGTPGELECTDITKRASCVMLANMFGDSVMWFAIVNANGPAPTRSLELPSLVDMLDNGDRGILANGWIVRLASPTIKTCRDDNGASRISLREFINIYSPNKSLSKMNLITDEVNEVVCSV